MSWKKISKFVGTAAPMLGGVLAGPGGAMFGKMLAGALNVDKTPEAVLAQIEKDPDKVATCSTDFQNANLEIIQAAYNQAKETTATYRQELHTGDKFVARWRPYFGYVVANTWLLQMITITAAVINTFFEDDPQAIQATFQGVTNLIAASSTMWAIALSVLGVYIHKRSSDKMVQAGLPVKGFLKNIMNYAAKKG